MDKKFWCPRCNCWTNVLYPVMGLGYKVCAICAKEIYDKTKSLPSSATAKKPKVRKCRLLNLQVKNAIDEALKIANWELPQIKLPNGKVI